MNKVTKWLFAAVLILIIAASFIPNPINIPLLWTWRTVLTFALVIIYLKDIYLPSRYLWVMSSISSLTIS
jgi:hypothetical protein